MKMMIIGTNGFLSNAFVQYANKTNISLYLCGRDIPIGANYDSFKKVDLSEELELNYYEECARTDVIVYAAGAGVQSNQRNNSDDIYHINTIVPVKLALGLRAIGYKGVLVTFGSYFEVGQSMTEKAREIDIKESFGSTPNDYIVSKRMLTHFVDSYKHDFTHWHFILPTIYGIGESENRLIPYTIQSILRCKKMQFTSGEQVRQYLHVSEVPNIVNVAYAKKMPSGVYNISGPDVVTVKEVVSMIHEFMSVPMQNDCFGAIARDDIGMRYLCLDGTYLQELLGTAPKKRLKDMLNEYISYGK